VKILLYTPTHGSPESASVSLGYHTATIQLSRSVDVQLLDGRMFTDCDLVRARSRAVRVFLDSPTATHLLHWDADVVGNVGDIRAAIDGMLASGHAFVGAPYPRKRFRIDRVVAGVNDHFARSIAGNDGDGFSPMTEAGLAALAYDYPYRFGDAAEGGAMIEVVNGCTEVDAMAFGFTLTSRACLEQMWKAYAGTLSFGDVVDDRLYWTVALFQLLLPQQSAAAPYAVGPLLSEDYSFCQRWRDIGGKVQMYVGAGSPLHHVGSHVFRGSREGVVQSVG